MSVTTLLQLGQDLPAWAALQKGERVIIAQRGRAVAQFVPPDALLAATQQVQSPAWPDFAARRRAIFGARMFSAGTAQLLVDEDRGA